MPIINLDGCKIRNVPPDLDGDGIVGGIERVSMDNPNNIIPIKQSSELGDSLEIAFSDNFNFKELVSDIDMKSNLHAVQIPYLAIFDSLCKMRFIGVKHLAISRQVKRLSVSEKTKNLGSGRRNIENMTTGKREQDRMGGDKASTFMVGEMKK